MKTALKTLTLLSGILALSVAAPSSAQADMSTTTSTLVISNEVYIPSDDAAVDVLTSETDVMPITNDTAVDAAVPQIALKAKAAPQELTPMPASEADSAAEAEILPVAMQAHTDVVLSWRARGGENLQDVISRWGGRAGQSFTWKTQDTSQIHRAFSYFGTYSDAVKELLDRETKPKNYVDHYTHNAGHRLTGLKKND
jgi:hypothetical protein|tara:strand:- start:315082 stop:315675 length:594 start_codon:yes stop_codon:yes gene_type:complete